LLQVELLNERETCRQRRRAAHSQFGHAVTSHALAAALPHILDTARRALNNSLQGQRRALCSFNQGAAEQVIGDDRYLRSFHARDAALIMLRSGISIPAFCRCARVSCALRFCPCDFMNELSQTTLRVIQQLFDSEQQSEVENILISECSYTLIPEQDAAWDKLRERVQLGVLKISNGNTDKLLSAIILAQTDWRDLLMAAGFGYSITEHENWAHEILEQ